MSIIRQTTKTNTVETCFNRLLVLRHLIMKCVSGTSIKQPASPSPKGSGDQERLRQVGDFNWIVSLLWAPCFDTNGQVTAWAYCNCASIVKGSHLKDVKNKTDGRLSNSGSPRKQILTRMWANAQCDGRPAEYRWHPLFNGAKFGWRPLLKCRAVTMPRRETRWN